MKKVIILLTFSIFLFSCGNLEKKENSNLSFGMAKENIVKGKTTQSEILSMFGSPNIITKNKDENEVWNYNRMSSDSKESSKGLWLLFGGANSGAVSKSSSSFDLIIVFDKEDIVKDYSVISAKF